MVKYLPVNLKTSVQTFYPISSTSICKAFLSALYLWRQIIEKD